MNDYTRRAMLHVLTRDSPQTDPERIPESFQEALRVIALLEPFIVQIEQTARELARQELIWESDLISDPRRWMTHACGCAERMPAFVFCPEHKKMLENPLPWPAQPVVYTTPATPTPEAERTAHESKEGSGPEEDREARDRSSS